MLVCCCTNLLAVKHDLGSHLNSLKDKQKVDCTTGRLLLLLRVVELGGVVPNWPIPEGGILEVGIKQWVCNHSSLLSTNDAMLLL